LMAALAAAPDARGRARAEGLLALLEGRSGRPAEALAWAERAEAEIGHHPALDRARGEALALVWRWPAAAEPLARAAAAAPLDDGLWRQLAQAQGSAGHAEEALEAAGRGLALQPRDGDLLLSQALALAKLGK